MVEKVEEKEAQEEVKDARTPAEKAYAAVQAKRVSIKLHCRQSVLQFSLSHSKNKRLWRKPRRPTSRE